MRSKKEMYERERSRAKMSLSLSLSLSKKSASEQRVENAALFLEA